MLKYQRYTCSLIRMNDKKNLAKQILAFSCKERQMVSQNQEIQMFLRQASDRSLHRPTRRSPGLVWLWPHPISPETSQKLYQYQFMGSITCFKICLGSSKHEWMKYQTSIESTSQLINELPTLWMLPNIKSLGSWEDKQLATNSVLSVATNICVTVATNSVLSVVGHFHIRKGR